MTDVTIEQRLARLELSARRWRRGCVGLAVAGLLAVGGGAMQNPKPGVVRATKLVIVDAKDNERITLDASDERVVGLSVADRDENVRSFFGTNEKGHSSLHFYDAREGDPRMSMGIFEAGGATLSMPNAKGGKVYITSVGKAGPTIKLTENKKP